MYVVYIDQYKCEQLFNMHNACVNLQVWKAQEKYRLTSMIFFTGWGNIWTGRWAVATDMRWDWG